MVRVAIGPPPASTTLVRAVVAAGGCIVDPSDAEVIIWAGRSGVGLRALLNDAPNAKWVQVTSAGVEWLFDDGIYSRRYVWTCAKGGEIGRNVAEVAMLMLLSAARDFHKFVRAREWLSEGGRPLAGSRIAIVGAGGIGRSLLERLRPFGVEVTVMTRTGAPLDGATRVVSIHEFDNVVAHMDAVVLALPSTPYTRNFIDERRLAMFRSGSWLVNVGRGALVDTDALVAAIRSDKLGGAALDVVTPEPLPPDHPLWKLPNVIVTPHIGNTEAMTGHAMAALLTENFARWTAGDTLIGIVEEEAGY